MDGSPRQEQETNFDFWSAVDCGELYQLTADKLKAVDRCKVVN
jgi:hypothetical protein